MVELRAFINLFFVPVVSLYIYYNRKSLEMKPSFDMLIKYIIMVVGVVPGSRFFTMIFRVLTDVYIETDSSYNTIAALLAAVLLPYVYEFGKKFWNRLR